MEEEIDWETDLEKVLNSMDKKELIDIIFNFIAEKSPFVRWGMKGE